MIFNPAEHAVIDAVKANTQICINNKKIFWNGITADCVIAGGYFASAFRDESFNDIDVFILNKNVSVYEALTDYKDGKWKIRDRDAGQYLQNSHIFGTATNTDTKVQYILTDYTSRKELLESFDYLHATVSYVPAENKLYITRGAFDACRKKQLRPNGSIQPKQWRCDKFMKRGWTVWHHDAGGAGAAHHQGLSDSFDHIIQDAVKDMLSRIKPTELTIKKHQRHAGITAQTLDDMIARQRGNSTMIDLDLEAFKKLIS